MKFKALSLVGLIFLTTNCGKESASTFEQLGLEEITISELQNGYSNGDYTVEQVVKAYLERIDAIDQHGPTLNSILTINPDALDIARKQDSLLQSGKEVGPLFGIPVVLKDNIARTTKCPLRPALVQWRVLCPFKMLLLLKSSEKTAQLF